MAQSIKTVASAIRASKENQSGATLQFPEDLGQHAILLMFKKYTFVTPGERRLISAADSRELVKDSILLPLPSNIADSYSLRVGRPEMGLIGEAVATAAAANASTVDSSGIVNRTVESIKKLGMSRTEAEDLIKNGSASQVGENVRFLLRSSIPGSMGTSIDQGLGSTANPKMSLSFDGVELKNHTFDWKFMVRSPNESHQLRSIQDTIRRNISPTYKNAGGFVRAMLEYPSVVDIAFVGIDDSYFMKFKTCMVQSFSLNFTPDSVAILEGGRPAGAMLSMNLVETDIHTAEDYGGTASEGEIEIQRDTDPGRYGVANPDGSIARGVSS